jgi:hypothetical protein
MGLIRPSASALKAFAGRRANAQRKPRKYHDPAGLSLS